MIRLPLALVLAAGSSLAATAAPASTVVIWPVDPTITAKQQATALWLENKGANPVTLQVRTLGWVQVSGDDALGAQEEVVASPPIAEVAPGQRQLVRLIRRAPAGATGERSYRLLIDELPAPPSAPVEVRASAQLAVQMRYSIPLFTYGKAEASAPNLAMRVEVIAGKRYLTIANAGERHARLTDLTLGSGAKAVVLRPGLAGYVLAGSTMRWELPPYADSSVVHVGVNSATQLLLPTA
jgi:fimbrial chaperone protein